MITILACSIALILIIWFQTDAVIEYGNLFGLKKLLKIEEYRNKKMDEPYPLTYPMFLKMKYDNFFIRMITCYICLAVWLSMIFCFIFGCITLMAPVCLYSLVAYVVLSALLKELS